MTNLIPYFIAWAALAVVVLILALMRRSVAQNEDDSLHLSSLEAAVANTRQVSVAKRLDAIDKWGKVLTVVLAVAGLALGTAWGLQMFEASSRAGLK